MIGTRGLDQDFDRLLETDVAAKYVIEHRSMSRSAHVPRQYLGKNPDGSVRNQEEFRVFASMLRRWEKQIIDGEAEKLIKQAAAKELRSQLIRIKAAELKAEAVLKAVRIDFIRHQSTQKKRSTWPFGQVIEFEKLFREVMTLPDQGLALV